ncbi:MAG: hypothetical protein ACMUHB_03415 [Thermoplasmatota archaeon]
MAFWSAKVLKSVDPLEPGPAPFFRKWVEVMTFLMNAFVLLVLCSGFSSLFAGFVSVDLFKGKPLKFCCSLLFRSFVQGKNVEKYIYKDLRKI